MPASNSFWNEAISAARGAAGLIIGDRTVERYFNLTSQGLAGSFIPVLLLTGIVAGLPMLFGYHGLALRAVGTVALTFVLQVAFTTIALAQARRVDGLVPYLVADNWSGFYSAVVGLGLNLMGVSDQIIGFPMGVLIVVLAVNIGRLILKLTPLQVAMFVVAQVAGYFAGALAVPLLLPLPDLAAVQ